MNKIPFALVGIILILTSCSRHSQVSCPSFKDDHNDISWSYHFPKAGKKKSNQAQIRSPQAEEGENGIREHARPDLLNTRPASAELYTSAEASAIFVTRSFNLPTKDTRQKFIKKGLAKPISLPGRISSMKKHFDQAFQNSPDIDPSKNRTRLNSISEKIPLKYNHSNWSVPGKSKMKFLEPDERKTNKMALAGFLLTMAGLLFTIIFLPQLGLFLVTVGMVFCLIGLIQILSNKKKWSGIKLAVAGLVIGSLLILGIIILIALYLG